MVKLGKKIVSLALVLGLTLSMGMVSFAAPSVGAGSNSTDKGGSVSAGSGTTDGVVTSNSTEARIAAYDPAAYPTADAKIRTTAGLRQILGNYYREGMILELLHVTEVIPNRDVTKQNPMTIGFNVPGVSAGDTIFVLHCYDGKNWEVVTTNAVGDKFVSATFTSLSPVAFVKATRKGNSSPTGLSPKTGMF